MTIGATLPGISFEVVDRPLQDVLPRMDVCGFVGFASSGPIDVPVLVKDPVTFRDVFGADPILARHADGTPLSAHLGASVEAFFANGGVRAWVVRVAATGDGGALTNHFAVPGLVVPGLADGTVTGWRIAAVPARSPGAWSDDLRAGGSLTTGSMLAVEVHDASVVVDHGVDVVAGDLLRLDLGEGRSAVLSVLAVDRHPAGTALTVDRASGWFVAEDTAPPTGVAWRLTTGDPVEDPDLAVESAGAGGVVAAGPATRLAPGDTVAFEATGPEGGLTIVAVGRERSDASQPADDRRRFAIEVMSNVAPIPPQWATDPALAPAGPVVVEVQRLRLAVTRGEELVAELDGLGFGPGHPRMLQGLPDDESLFAPLAGLPATVAVDGIGLDELAHRRSSRAQPVTAPRFPLAGPRDAPALLPLGITTDPAAVVAGPPPAEVDRAPAPDRDGLGSFGAELFVDPALAPLGVATVVAAAHDLVHVQRRPRRLRGMHALVPNDDLTMLCLPDAVHPGWDRVSVPVPAPLTAPALTVSGVDDDGVALTWTTVLGASSYEVQHAGSAGFDDRRSLTTDRTAIVFDEWDGCSREVHLRVRAGRGTERGPWSNVVAVVVPPTTFGPCAHPPVPAPADPPAPPAPAGQVARRARTGPQAHPWTDLRAIQTAALRWCASRGDVLALLSLPATFTADDAARHVSVLRGATPAFDPSGRPGPHPFLTGGVPALTEDEGPVLGFGALHHPWPVVGSPRVGQEPRPVPPDGAIAGSFAARAISRGAWVAAARRPLRDVVALAPAIDASRSAELAAGSLNPIAQDPSGFMALTSSTMSDVAALRPVNVRRLVMLLRRLAVREGTGLVFEPNDHELHRLVQLRFERLLTSLFRRGAFAGATPAEGFEVSTGGAVNPPASFDRGRFVVEVRVAPSRPLEFLTVRLVLAGNDVGAAEVRA